MTEKKIRAVAEAIHSAECVVPLSKRDGHIQEVYFDLARAAIKAIEEYEE